MAPPKPQTPANHGEFTELLPLDNEESQLYLLFSHDENWNWCEEIMAGLLRLSLVALCMCLPMAVSRGLSYLVEVVGG
jgi:hypothetical protein